MGIKGIGNDIVEVDRMASKLDRPDFIKRVFTPNEINYCSAQTRPAEHFAARFAAKEAYMKALGEGWTSKADFLEIEVLKKENGSPFIKLHDKAKVFFDSLKHKSIFVSLSHTSKTALAFVIIES